MAFDVEWFDPVAKLLQKMYLKFFTENNTLELLQGSKFFLARIYYPDVTISDLYIGNFITIYNRRFEIKDYSNSASKEYMEAREKHFLCLMGASNMKEGLLGNLVTLGSSYDLKVARIKSTGSGFSADDLTVSAGDVLIEIVGITISSELNSFVGAVHSLSPSGLLTARQSSPQAISDIFSACTPVRVPSSGTLCLVKPHVLQSNGYTGTYSFKLDGRMVWDNKQKELNRCGELLSAITDAGFVIEAANTFHLNMSMAEEFFDVYRTVLKNYVPMLEQITSGPLLALLVTSSNEDCMGDTVSSFRDLCGPIEPEIARTLRPKSLRAIFGQNFERNAVHCTDLPEDGEIECIHFFETLSCV